jgi:hypothetical protein
MELLSRIDRGEEVPHRAAAGWGSRRQRLDGVVAGAARRGRRRRQQLGGRGGSPAAGALGRRPPSPPPRLPAAMPATRQLLPPDAPTPSATVVPTSDPH